VLLGKYPLTEERQKELRDRIEARSSEF